MEPNEVRALAKFILREMESQHSAELAHKWVGGTIKVIPGDKNTKENEISIDKLMHKIVMIRDNLRVLEQQINSNKNLDDAERLKFQGYITKCYGSMTSFNFLFYEDEDKF